MRQEKKINRFALPVYKSWNSGWFLLSSGDFKTGHFNCMTVAWGGFGDMWNLPIAMVVVRPTRYTYEFINDYDEFTLCAYSKQYQKALSVLGTKSGRDGDKLKEAGLTAESAVKVAAPVYKEADLAIECRKIYWQDFDPAHFLDESIHKHYDEQDYHRMFYGEILCITADPEKYPDW